MQFRVFGLTSSGLPIASFEFGDGGTRVLILAGVHGDETEGVEAAHALLGQWLENFPYNLRLTLVPQFNLDGCLHRTRGNKNGIDLNRNMPTRDWSAEIQNPRYNPGAAPASEPETRALVDYCVAEAPQLIISLHSWHPVINVNGSRALAAAEAIAAVTKYRVDAEIGYPTPGCLGTWAGLEREYPTITYEIERGSLTADIIDLHPRAIDAALKVMEAQKS